MRRFFVTVLPLVASLAGCSAHPPPNFAHGGAPLAIGRARWERGDTTVDVTEDGRVLVDGDHLWTIDAAGRVYEPDRDPFALLAPDGRLLGTDDKDLGQIGLANASPPGGGPAWLTVLPTGQVVLYDADGNRVAGGAWSGCQGPVFRTCTLVTHLVTMRDVARRPHVGVGFGFGFGVGFH